MTGSLILPDDSLNFFPMMMKCQLFGKTFWNLFFPFFADFFALLVLIRMERKDSCDDLQCVSLSDQVYQTFVHNRYKLLPMMVHGHLCPWHDDQCPRLADVLHL